MSEDFQNPSNHDARGLSSDWPEAYSSSVSLDTHNEHEVQANQDVGINSSIDADYESPCGFSVRNSKLELLNRIMELATENNILKIKLKLIQQQISDEKGTIYQPRKSVNLTERPNDTPEVNFLKVKEEQEMVQSLTTEHVSSRSDSSDDDDEDIDMWKKTDMENVYSEADVENTNQVATRIELDNKQHCIDGGEVEACGLKLENTDTVGQSTVNSDGKKRRFHGKSRARAHKRGHTKGKTYNCEKCEKSFTWATSFRRHVNMCKIGKLSAPTLDILNQKPLENLNYEIVNQNELDEQQHSTNNIADTVICASTHATSEDGSSYDGKKNFACEICGQEFHVKALVRYHMRIHTNEKPYECEFCKKLFAWKSNWTKHRKRCKQNITIMKEIPETCSKCGKEFTDQIRYDEHMKYHIKRDKGYLFKCKICRNSFQSKETLLAHIKIHGKKVKTFTCNTCNKQFRSRTNYERHIQLYPCNGKNYVRKRTACEVCGKYVTTMKIHMRTHDPDDKPYQCTECGKRFRQKCGLEMHLLDHTGERPHQCHVCNKGCKTAAALREHMIVHTGQRSHICDICGRGLGTASGLRAHIRNIHTGAKVFSCGVCQKAYTSMAALKSHSISHSDARPFICEICSKGFKTQNKLSAHKPVHTGERKYKCLYCEDRFKQAGHRNTHMKLVHKHMMKPKLPY